MSRRFKQTYNCPPLHMLAKELLYAPTARRAEQVRRMEQLHDQIQDEAAYPLAYLFYRITRYRPEHDDDTLLVGRAVRSDLRLMVDELSRSFDMAATPDEQVHTLDEWAAQLQVSRKTLERWRRDGLRWRWFMPQGGDERLVGLERQAIESYRVDHSQRLSRAAAFSHLDQNQRRQLLELAREIKQQHPQLSLRQAAVRLAESSGRSVEAIRRMLEKHEAIDPIFPERHGPLSGRQKRVIARAAQLGVAPSTIAAHFGRSRASIHRIVQTQRAYHLRQQRITYIRLPTFERPDAEEVLLSPPLSLEPDGPTLRVDASDLPATVQPLYRRAGYSPRTLRSIFVRYNYLKFKADRLRSSLSPYRPRVAELERFQQWMAQARQLRQALVQAHLPTVLSVIRRHLLDRSRTAARLIELLKIGHSVLFESIDSFNPSRRIGFDAYLRNRLLRRLAGEPDEDVGRAHRRYDDADALAQLQEHARRFDVDVQSLFEER
ncbi:MAG: hypothetical protein IT445_01015 [Phycisphaeraceae bacterium]|nr:hypothetical protein [Phycisphaeraceae bacterium]